MTKEQLETIVRIGSAQFVDLFQCLNPTLAPQLLIVAKVGDDIQVKAINLDKEAAKELVKQLIEFNAPPGG